MICCLGEELDELSFDIISSVLVYVMQRYRYDVDTCKQFLKLVDSDVESLSHRFSAVQERRSRQLEHVSTASSTLPCTRQTAILSRREF